MTPEEALERLRAVLIPTPFEQEALDTLGAFIKQVREHGSGDLEWGEPGDCWDRMYNDDDERAEALGPNGTDITVLPDEALQEAMIAKDLGRHYGDPHCIWCLEAQ